MVQTMKRSLAWVLVLVMFVAFVPTLIVNVDAAGNVNYVYSGKYIYNWGTRGTVATFLSPNAEKFYDKNNTTYAKLSSYSGGTGKSDAPSSALYDVLHDLMKDNHSYETSYDATRNLYQYTDCQNSGKDSKKISSFYSGKEIGPSWDGGKTWNREHTWPDSKGLGGYDENDIMMLRPTSSNENSSRGNIAYGQSNGYYHPNSESNGNYDLRGDTARIFLYVYVRWGNINYAWGTNGVMESVEVLLTWIEEDPVDTWELGRNDSVESITGTRNVFVDYPELAFLLFGEEIPTDMQTPSGAADNKCDHNNFNSGVTTAPTCTDKGYTLYTCQTAGCGYSYKDNFVAAKGHNYVNDVCSICGEAQPTTPTKPTYVTELTVGKAYKLGLFSTTEYFFTGTIVNDYYGASDTNYENGVDVYVEETNDGYYLYFKNDNGTKQYINLVAKDKYRNFTISSTPSSVYVWDVTKNTLSTQILGEACYIGNYGQYSSMNGLRASDLKDTDYIARLYTTDSTSTDNPSDNPSDNPTDTPCQHNYQKTVTAPTCTAGGFTTFVCTLCANSYVGDKTAAKGHSYTNGTCATCGATQPSTGTSTEATIRFDNKANRTVFNKAQQVWVQNGITVTNDKANSTSDVADYIAPARFYKGSNITITYPGMTKIVIVCNTSSYASACAGAITESASVSGTEVTVTFAQAVDSFKFSASVAQIRIDSITVYGQGQSQTPQQCTHSTTEIVAAISATCTTNGFSGNTICKQCNTILEEGKVIAALGHTDANNDKTCDVCNEQISSTTTHVFAAWVTIREATCTKAGLERRDCDHCSDYETRELPALGHSDTDNNNVCDVCDEELTQNENTTPETPEDEEHICEEVSGFKAFWNAIVNFFRRLFGKPELCPCGKTTIDKKEQ